MRGKRFCPGNYYDYKFSGCAKINYPFKGKSPDFTELTKNQAYSIRKVNLNFDGPFIKFEKKDSVKNRPIKLVEGLGRGGR